MSEPIERSESSDASLSSRATAVRHFLVMEILERAQALEAQGRDIVHLEVGEPDFDTPAAATTAGIEALRAGRTHYTHSLGIAPLRDTIARHIEKDYGSSVDADRVVVTTGSSAALVLAFAALLDPGDEVLVSDPGYACYPNIIKALDGRPVPVPVSAGSGFAYDPEVVREHITPRTKAIVVNSPSNPMGTITHPDVLRALTELGPVIVSDEIYHGLTYEGSARSVLEYTSDAYVVSGFSKRYAMTGWRLGHLVCPSSAVRHIQALQQNLYISPPDFGQWAALAALDAHDEVDHMREEFDVRRKWLLEALGGIGLPVPVTPQGAFYVWVDVSRYTNDSAAFAVDVLERASVAVAPGIDFGARGEGFIRLSYATSLDRIREGVRRLEGYLSSTSR